MLEYVPDIHGPEIACIEQAGSTVRLSI